MIITDQRLTTKDVSHGPAPPSAPKPFAFAEVLVAALSPSRPQVIQ
jgi:hypothetical protein